jgi:hypothetical protein
MLNTTYSSSANPCNVVDVNTVRDEVGSAGCIRFASPHDCGRKGPRAR